MLMSTRYKGTFVVFSMNELCCLCVYFLTLTLVPLLDLVTLVVEIKSHDSHFSFILQVWVFACSMLFVLGSFVIGSWLKSDMCFGGNYVIDLDYMLLPHILRVFLYVTSILHTMSVMLVSAVEVKLLLEVNLLVFCSVEFVHFGLQLVTLTY